MTAPMSPETRALIVRRLREEAARLEAGGEPRECVARGENNTMTLEYLDTNEARSAAHAMLDIEKYNAIGACWSDEVTQIWWGVVVAVEEVRLTERECNYGGNIDADETWEFGLVDAGAPVAELPLGSCEDDDCQTCHPWCEVCKIDLVDGACPQCGEER